LRERDVMYEEELLEAESEQNGTAEQEEQTAASAKIKLNIRSTCDGIRNTEEIFGWKW